jgi:anthranilate phosphoribosyltransferase
MIATIDTSQPAPGPFDTDEAYCQFVMSNAALSYQAQYSAATADEGITAAREAYNAGLPAPAPEETL